MSSENLLTEGQSTSPERNDCAVQLCEARKLSEFAGYLLAVLVVVVAGLCIYLIDSHWFWQDDFQSYQLANYWEMGRALSKGEFPLLTSNSWECTALAGEYQNGVFSVVILAIAWGVYIANVPLPLAATIYSVAHLAILSAGTYRFARNRRLPISSALFVAWNTTFAGWIMTWGACAWFPALASFAWLPWFWGSLEVAIHRSETAAPGQRWWLMSLVREGTPAAFFLYLVITAGWPFTVLMAVLISAWMFLRPGLPQFLLPRRFVDRGPFSVENAADLPTTAPADSSIFWRKVTAIEAVWILGLGLSAPAWIMLVEYTGETLRGQTATSQLQNEWTVPLKALPGLFLPSSRVAWNVFGSIKDHSSVELAGGLLPISILIAAAFRDASKTLRAIGWELGLFAIVLLLSVWPSMWAFRWSFRWIPLAILVLSLAAGKSLSLLGEVGVSRLLSPGHIAAILVLVAWIVTLFSNRTLHPDLARGISCQAVLLIGFCLGWGLYLRTCGEAFLKVSTACLGPVLSMISLGVPQPMLDFPAWNKDLIDEAVALDPERRYLSIHEFSDIFDTDPQRIHQPTYASHRGFLPGNFNQYRGIEFINGYSPMQPMGLLGLFRIGLHGYLGVSGPRSSDSFLQPALDLISSEAGPSGLLEWAGVNGLIVSDRHRNLIPRFHSQGWRTVRVGRGSTILHRDEGDYRSVRVVESAVITDVWDSVITHLADSRGALQDGRRIWPIYVSHGNTDASPQFVSTQFPLEDKTVYAGINLGNVKTFRNSVSVELSRDASDKEAIVVFSRPWLPGYRATLNGNELVVGRFCNIMPSVTIPYSQSGELRLYYFPRSLYWGLCAMVSVIVVLVVAWVVKSWPRGDSLDWLNSAIRASKGA